MRKLVCLLIVIVAITACGKKGPLIYPDMLLPAAPSGVTARQFGNSIKLTFVLPSKDLAGRNFTGLTAAKILKRDEPTGQIPGCSACTTDYSLFRTLNLELLQPEAQRYGNLMMLLDGDVQTDRIYTYRVSTVTSDNQEGGLSAPVSVAMITAPLPPVLQVSSHPTEIQLEFVGYPPNQGIIAGYNVYRTLKGETFLLQPLNREILTGNRFVDVGLDRGTSYIYGVRTVMRMPSGNLVESSLSNMAEGKLKDDE